MPTPITTSRIAGTQTETGARFLELDSAGGTAAVLFSPRSRPRASATWTTTINIALEGRIEVESRGSTARGRVVVTPAGLHRVSRSEGPVLTILLDADAHRAARDEASRDRSFEVDAPEIVAGAAGLLESSGDVLPGALGLAERLFPLGPRRLADPRIGKLVTLLREGAAAGGLPALAGAIGVTPGHLSERFAAVVGLPLRSWLLWQRVRRALTILGRADAHAEPRAGGAGIACAAGFSDQPHMVRTFSRMLAYTPGALGRALRSSPA